MSDYTPTTEEVSIGWAWYKSGWIHSDEIQPQFDRWLAEVKAQAWEDGFIRGVNFFNAGDAPNPYRQGEGSGNGASQSSVEPSNLLNGGEEQ